MKKFLYAMCIALLATLLLSGIASACPNPYSCPGTTYNIEYGGEKYHFLVCTICRYKTVYSHFGGQATCTKRAICEGCGHEYGPQPIGQHTWGAYTSDGNATCTADGTKTAKCTNCVETHSVADVGSALGHSFTSYVADGNATCTQDGTKSAKCTNCGETHTVADVGSALGHSFTNYVADGNATCTQDGTKTAKCTNCGKTDTVADVGSALGHSFTNYVADGNATCTADGTKTAKCTNCGETHTVADVGSALGHHYKAVVTAPTCVKSGYTTYTCTRCNDIYTANKTAARKHWYGLWSSCGDLTHSATCLRSGCGHIKTVNCVFYTVTVGDILFSFCPVCGDLDGKTMEALEATVTNADNEVAAIPGRGELIVRGLETPFNGALYALTAAYEYAGKVDPLNGPVEITVPVELEASFRVVRVDVTPATEETERTEVWTEIPFSYENGELTFETDIDGLFLLIPAE